jgi:DNA (cytosine-5)-methyltransferase 1
LQGFVRKVWHSHNCHINYIVDDFLLHDFDKRYDFVIGNPPFFKMKSNDSLLKKYQASAVNKRPQIFARSFR